MAKKITNAPCIVIPKSSYTEKTLNNLSQIVERKHGLIAKSLGVTELPIRISGKNIEFYWLTAEMSTHEREICTLFIEKLCEMASKQKRINETQKIPVNEKYAFRCFLLRLGLIGDEYKAARKYLLSNLDGDSAFKGGKRNAISE